MDSNARPPGCAVSQLLQDSIALHQVTALLVVSFLYKPPVIGHHSYDNRYCTCVV